MSKSAVIGIVFNDDRTQILLIKRRDISIWVLPGGGVEENEPLPNAIIREIEEETGLIVTIVRKIGEYTPVNRFTVPTHLYECRAINGKTAASDEALEVDFFRLNKLPQPLFHLHSKWINEAREISLLPFKRPLTGVDFLDFIKYACLHPVRTIRFMLSRLGIPFNTSQK